MIPLPASIPRYNSISSEAQKKQQFFENFLSHKAMKEKGKWKTKKQNDIFLQTIIKAAF